MDPGPSLANHRSILRMYRRQSAPPSLVPPGVTPNYINPDTIGDQVTSTSLTLIVFSTIFVVARLSIKLRVVKKQSWDDYAEHYYLGYHIWDIPPPELMAKGEMQKNVRRQRAQSIMSTKIAILLLYKTLFGIKKSFRYLCYGMMAIVTSYCIIFFFIEAFNCNPVAKTWHALTFTGPAKCFDNSMIQFVIGGFNIATDFIILVMPMPIILDLNMDSKRKIGLVVIFSTGVFVFASTIVREVIVVQTLRDFDQSWVTVPETVWLTVENDIGIICACLPALAPLRTTRFFSKVVPGFMSYLRSKGSYGSSKGGGGGSSGYPPSRGGGPSKGVLGYHHTPAESGAELVDTTAPKNGAYISANHGDPGWTHENGTIRRETDMQVFYSSRSDALV
ncbi:MAG: hypothetical protein Q9207_007854 [Kuettlingeria erythrocarpa]